MGTKVEVAILYANLKVVRVSWADKRTLDLCNVEAIAVIAEQWRQCSIMHDFYHLVWTDSDCNLSGHDGDYGFYPFDARDPNWRFPFIMPENSLMFTTEHAMLNKEDWQKVLEIYADPDGSMF